MLSGVYDRTAAPIPDYREEDGSRNAATIREESRLGDSNLSNILQAVAVWRRNEPTLILVTFCLIPYSAKL
jgi:hypothetical protein